MKFCANCGNGNEDDSKFCRKCGTAFGVAGTVSTQQHRPAPTPPSARPAEQAMPSARSTDGDVGTSSLSPNLAHFLCYVGGWITGIVFLIIEQKDRDTRFHAWQSIIALGGISVIAMVVYLTFSFIAAARLFGVSMFLGWIINAILIIIYILGLVLWIVLMVKAYQGQNYHLAIAGAIAHNLAYKDTPAISRPAAQKTAPPETITFDLPPAPAARKVNEKSQANKYCIACGESLPLKAAFCSRCGEKQP